MFDGKTKYVRDTEYFATGRHGNCEVTFANLFPIFIFGHQFEYKQTEDNRENSGYVIDCRIQIRIACNKVHNSLHTATLWNQRFTDISSPCEELMSACYYSPYSILVFPFLQRSVLSMPLVHLQRYLETMRPIHRLNFDLNHVALY